MSTAKSNASTLQKSANKSGISGPSGGKVKSPCSNPADILSTIGGMPPTKKVEEINKANEPKSAPGSVMGDGAD